MSPENEYCNDNGKKHNSLYFRLVLPGQCVRRYRESREADTSTHIVWIVAPIIRVSSDDINRSSSSSPRSSHLAIQTLLRPSVRPSVRLRVRYSANNDRSNKILDIPWDPDATYTKYEYSMKRRALAPLIIVNVDYDTRGFAANRLILPQPHKKICSRPKGNIP